MTPVTFGCVGLGGYAGSICELLESMTDAPQPMVRLSAACEPDQATHAQKIAELQRRGVPVFANYEDLLASDVESVWLPLPIDLHRPFSERALAAGKAVMCEKPVAGTVDDLDAMIAARDRAARPLTIGFQHMYLPEMIGLKRRLLDGRIGHIKSAALCACWPRDSRYYQRNAWAGRLKHRGVWVLDSPANNALAHYINMVLFLLGREPYEAAQCRSIEAELYRANAIENYDTCSIRIRTDNGATFLILLTHACSELVNPQVRLEGGAGSITFTASDRLQLEGRERELVIEGDSRAFMVRRFVHLLRGVADEAAVATLETSRPHLVTINAASQASPARTIAEPFIEEMNRDGGTLRAIKNIDNLLQTCAAKGKMLHESGLAPWTSPAAALDTSHYRNFHLASVTRA